MPIRHDRLEIRSGEGILESWHHRNAREGGLGIIIVHPYSLLGGSAADPIVKAIYRYLPFSGFEILYTANYFKQRAEGRKDEPINIVCS